MPGLASNNFPNNSSEPNVRRACPANDASPMRASDRGKGIIVTLTPNDPAFAARGPWSERIRSSSHLGSTSRILAKTLSNATSAPPIWPLGLRKTTFKIQRSQVRDQKADVTNQVGRLARPEERNQDSVIRNALAS